VGLLLAEYPLSEMIEEVKEKSEKNLLSIHCIMIKSNAF
jgi:hypothetical protein